MRDPVHLGRERRIISSGLPHRGLFSRPYFKVEEFDGDLNDSILAACYTRVFSEFANMLDRSRVEVVGAFRLRNHGHSIGIRYTGVNSASA